MNWEARLLTPPRRLGWWVAGILALAAAVLAWLAPADLVFTSPRGDIPAQFAAWRAFAADSVRAGHLPLWNPYTYSGEPFLGGFQSALLYVPNVLFLFLSLSRAFNFSLLLHLIWLGCGMGWWARRRGLHPLAALWCGLILPLSGPVFPHLYAGHVPNLCSMAWAPWLLAGLEEAWRPAAAGISTILTVRARGRGLLLAAAAAAMQIFAGAPQYVFYTAVAAGLLALVNAFAAKSAVRARVLPLAVVVAGYLVGAALAAAQLLPGLAATAESVRQGKLEYDFARMFSFPLENFLTMLAPGFFGDLTAHPYWGRCYLWEMSLFGGVSGLVLGVVALANPLSRFRAWRDLAVAGALLLLAVGDVTPIFHILYDHAPYFGQLRGWSKFTFPAMLFLVQIAGAGADGLIRGGLPAPRLSRAALLLAAVVGLTGWYIWMDPLVTAGWLKSVGDTKESFLPASIFTEKGFVLDAGAQAGRALMQAAATLALCGAALMLAGRRPAWRWLLLVFGPLEMVGFAFAHAGSSSLAGAAPQPLRDFLANNPGDYRIINQSVPENGFLLKAPDIYGNDPAVLKRYADLINYSQVGNITNVTQNLPFAKPVKVFDALRLKYAFVTVDDRVQKFENPRTFPHGVLLDDYKIAAGPDAVLAAVTADSFDLRHTVVLETEPTPRPVAGDGDPGTVKIAETSPDTLEIEADTTRPALLLVTDPFSRDWQARALPGSAQPAYTILPADYALRAVPLAAGHHHFVMEYIPSYWHLGLAVSAAAWLVWLALAWVLRPRRPAPA